MKKITVVIPNFNGMQYVERCLDSLERQTFSDFDVIFVDNGSVDGSRELTEKKYPWMDDAGNYYNCLGWAFALGKGKPEENYLKERKIFASCGGAAIYRTELVKKLGGFDEEHFAYLEDIDLGYRAQIAGYKNWYLPKATINSRSGILREIISICFIKTCPFCRSF